MVLGAIIPIRSTAGQPLAVPVDIALRITVIIAILPVRGTSTVIHSIDARKPAPAAAHLPNDLPAFMQQQIDDIRLIQERYAWFLDGVFADAVFEKKKGQKKIPLAPMICSRGYEAFISGVSLGKDPEIDAPPVKTQYRIRGEKEKAEIVEKMYFDRLLDFVYVEFMKGLQKGFVPKRCANCGRWFLQTPGVTFAYCTGSAPEGPGKTCREIGAASSFKDKVANNEVWQVQQRAYKKYYARTMRKDMT